MVPLVEISQQASLVRYICLHRFLSQFKTERQKHSRLQRSVPGETFKLSLILASKVLFLLGQPSFPKIRSIEWAYICLSLKEVSVHAGHKVRMEIDIILLIAGDPQGFKISSSGFAQLNSTY